MIHPAQILTPTNIIIFLITFCIFLIIIIFDYIAKYRKEKITSDRYSESVDQFVRFINENGLSEGWGVFVFNEYTEKQNNEKNLQDKK